MKNKQTIHTQKSESENQQQHTQGISISPTLRSRPLTLTRSLRATLHLLRGEVPQVTAGDGVAALGVALAAAEAELLVLLLALVVDGGGVAVAGALAGGLGGGVFDGNVEEVFGVVCGAGGVGLALCLGVSIFFSLLFTGMEG